MGAGQIGIELNRESQMPALLRGSTIAIVVLTAAACREDAESPTAPLVAEPEVASATQALTFRQVSGGDGAQLRSHDGRPCLLLGPAAPTGSSVTAPR